jgi:iron complex outermembrane receptor protein
MVTKPASVRDLSIHPLAMLVVLGSSCLPAQASAQEKADTAAPAPVLEEVVVSARKRAENLQQTPVSVSAFVAEELEQRQVTSTADIGNLVPNVQFDGVASESGGGASTQMSIRGIGQTDYVLTVEPGVAVYLDGVYISKSVGSLLNTVDLEQVEVLRGPQGTLFGRNTIGGAILLTSKRPGNEPEFSVEAATGSFNRADIKTVLSEPVNDVLKMRFSGAYQSRDGYVDRVLPNGDRTGATQGGTHDLSGRLTAVLDLSPSLSATLAVDGSRMRDESPGQVLVRADETAAFASLYNAFVPGGQCLPTAGTARFSNPSCYNSQWVKPINSLTTTNSGPNVSDTNVWGSALTLDWDAGLARVKSIAAYRKVNLEVSQDITASPGYFNDIGQSIEFEQLSEELQLSGKAFNQKLQYIVGLYGLHEQGSQAFPVNLTLVQFLSGGLIDNNSYAGFGQVTYNFTDRFGITGGLRYTDETRKFNPQQYIVGYNARTNVAGFVNPLAGAFGPPGQPLFPAGWYRRSGSATTPSLTLDFKLTSDLYSYFTYSEGFKGGGFVMRYFPPVVPAPGTNPDSLVGYAKPETARLYELGIKSEWLEHRLRVNASVFRTDYKDLQITFNIDPDGAGPIGAFVPVLANAGTARIQGVELETEFAATDWLRLNASGGYLDAKYLSFSTLAIQQLPSLPTELPNAPEFTGNIGFVADFARNHTGRWFMRCDYSYRSEQFKEFTNDPTLKQPAYGILNASLNYLSPDAHWSASLGGTNLTDKIYIVSGVTNNGIGYSQAVVSRPREWFLRLKYSH